MPDPVGRRTAGVSMEGPKLKASNAAAPELPRSLFEIRPIVANFQQIFGKFMGAVILAGAH